MTILPLDPATNATPEALRDFLGQCRAGAVRAGRAQLVSISLEVGALDPLAVLESIFERGELHFYVERPAEHLAVAGAEAVLSFTTAGADRFAACQRFIDETLSTTIAVGDQRAPFAGPHFFTAFTFLPEVESGESFPSAQVLVPRWQVGQRDGRTVAVANLVVAPDAPVEALAERVWRAHAKFRAFNYAEPGFASKAMRAPIAVCEVGGDDHYRNAVARALELIGAQILGKIVLARAKDLQASEPFHPLRALNGLRERYTDCFAFSVANGRGQSFIGASPERLLRVRDGRLTTEALAGSVRRGESASEDAALGGALLGDEKELREHRLVIASIERRLAPLGIIPEHSDKPVLFRLANVQHLHTPVHATLPAGVRLLDVLARLHPTPAVGGTPREAALPRIRALEGFPRGLYAGALGWIDAHGGGEFFVGLRSALIDGANARLYAGAGIVAGSSPEKEFAETELKFQAMQEAFKDGVTR
ncbi:MAG TPA: isochorismate synthase [Opitutaceae bacterium]|nr:isochorismate synthase [Opitutaceae bacterium]